MVQWYWMVFLNTIEVPLKPDYIIERSNGTEWYFYIPLIVSLKNVLTLNGPMVRTKWYSQIPLRILLKYDLLLKGMFQYRCEYHWSVILSLNGPMVPNGIEWYYKLPLRIPLSPTEIPLNGPMVLNGIQWYSMVYHWLFFCQGHW